MVVGCSFIVGMLVGPLDSSSSVALETQKKKKQQVGEVYRHLLDLKKN
jgi:hypothetical protein